MKRHESEIRKVAEFEAIRQAVRNEISQPSNADQLQIVKERIAAAIAAGDDERARFLMDLAERMKKLD